MANSFYAIRKGLSLTPTVLPVSGEVGDIACDISDNEIKRWDGLSWVKVGSGGGVIVVADTTERNNIPEEERTDCMLVGVVDNDTIYKLIGQPTGATTTNANWDQVITSANIATLANKNIDGGTASNTSRLTTPKGSIETIAALARKEATLLYNTSGKRGMLDNGTSLKGIPDFGNLDVFAQVRATDSIAADFVTTGSANATLTKDTHPLMGEAFKLTITSATGANLFSTRRGIDYAVPEEFRGQYVQLTYNYISDVAKGSICFEVTNLFDASTIVYTTELQAQPDATGVLTKGYIFFTVPQTASTIRIAMKRPSGAPDITAKTFWFNNIELRKYQMIINPIRPAIGTIEEFAGPVASIPYGFLHCNGAAVSRSTYAKLFAVIGTTYGTGDGSTTFNLPNSQGIGLRGVGTQTFGSKTYTATLGQKRNDNFEAHKHLGAGVHYTGDTNGYVSSYGSITQPNASGRIAVGTSTQASNQPYTSSAGSGTETNGADLAVTHMICFDDGPARYADYTLNQDVRVSAIRGTAQTGVNVNNSFVKILFDSIAPYDPDTTNSFSVANSRYTSKVSGTTSFYCSVIVLPTNVIDSVYVVWLYRNGAPFAPLGRTNGVAGKTFSIQGDIDVSDVKVDDYFELYLFGSGNNSVNTLSISDSTRFTVSKLATSQQLFAPIGPIPTVSLSGGSYTVQANDTDIYMLPSATATTVTLPSVTISSGRSITFYNRATSNLLTLNTVSGEQVVISGGSSVSSYVVGQNGATTLTSNGVAWYVSSSSQERRIVKTYQSGTSWYEVYSDGWVRQGGLINSAGASEKTTTYIIAMLNSDYNLIAGTNAAGSGTVSWQLMGVRSRTTSNFVIYSDGTLITRDWTVQGYGNSAAVKALGANPSYS